MRDDLCGQNDQLDDCFRMIRQAHRINVFHVYAYIYSLTFVYLGTVCVIVEFLSSKIRLNY